MKDVKQVVAQLRKQGAEMVNNVVVKNVQIKDMDNYTRVSLSLNKEVKQFIVDDNGDYVLGTNNVIFTSTYSIAAVLANNEDIAFAKNIILQSPELLVMLLSYATVDILLEEVKAGTEYINPFSSRNESNVIEHDSIFVHIVEINLGKKGQKIVQMLEDKMLDSMLACTFGKVAAGIESKED